MSHKKLAGGQGHDQTDNEVREKRRQRRSKTETKLSFEFYLSEGNTYQNSGDFNRAITGYTKALDIRPDHKVCLLARSECYLRLGDTQSAIVDANATIQDDPKFIKGVLQKANIYYQMGEFEYALVLYHRGNKLRPDIDSFRLGIQLCQEAVENSIGEKAQVKLEKKGDLSFFVKLQQSGKDQDDRRTKREMTSEKFSRQQSTSNKTETSSKDEKTVKQLLEELYTDKKFLENIMKDSEKSHSKSTQSEAVVKLSANCLNYLDTRATFWQQKQPTYARRKKSETSQSVVRRTQDIASWAMESLQEADHYLSQEDHEKCLKTVKAVIGQLDCCSDTSDRHHVELRSTAYSYMGNAHFERDDYVQALKYHKKDYGLAKKHELPDALVRSLDNIGRTLIRQEKFTEALKFFEERQPMVSDSLERAWLHHEIGRCHQKLKQFTEALDHGQQSFDAAVEVADEIWQMNALILVAESHRGLKKLSAAVETFQQCLVLANANDDEAAATAIQRSIDDIEKEIANNEERSSHHSHDQDQDQDQEDGLLTERRQSRPHSPDNEQTDVVGERRADTVAYTVTVTISDVDNAGTNVPVHIELIGDRGATRKIELDEDSRKKERKFERASENTFTVRAVDVGKITSLRISQDSKIPGSGPHIARVHVHCGGSKESYMFLCHQWLDKNNGDKLTARELRPVPNDNDQASYHVVVRTGDDETAGTDAKVFLQIFGDIGETDPLLLDTTQSGNNTFKPSQSNEFDLQAVNVGQVRKIRIEHKGSSPWLLEDVMVELAGKSFKFACSQRIEGNRQLEFLIAD